MGGRAELVLVEQYLALSCFNFCECSIIWQERNDDRLAIVSLKAFADFIETTRFER